MSIVLVCFSNAPKVSDEAVKKDAELDKYLESRVEGKKSILFTRNDVIAFLSMKTKPLKAIMPLYVGSNSGVVVSLNFCVSGKNVFKPRGYFILVFHKHFLNVSFRFVLYLYRSKCNLAKCYIS